MGIVASSCGPCVDDSIVTIVSDDSIETTGTRTRACMAHATALNRILAPDCPVNCPAIRLPGSEPRRPISIHVSSCGAADRLEHHPAPPYSPPLPEWKWQNNVPGPEPITGSQTRPPAKCPSPPGNLRVTTTQSLGSVSNTLNQPPSQGFIVPSVDS